MLSVQDTSSALSVFESLLGKLGSAGDWVSNDATFMRALPADVRGPEEDVIKILG